MVTTPLDVVKTRLMLHDSSKETSIGVVATLRSIAKEGKLFAGVVPRVMWISIGGFIFFGAYEKTKCLIDAATTTATP